MGTRRHPRFRLSRRHLVEVLSVSPSFRSFIASADTTGTKRVKNARSRNLRRPAKAQDFLAVSCTCSNHVLIYAGSSVASVARQTFATLRSRPRSLKMNKEERGNQTAIQHRYINPLQTKNSPVLSNYARLLQSQTFSGISILQNFICCVREISAPVTARNEMRRTGVGAI